MAEKQKTPLGPIGEAVMANVRRIREGHRLTYVELSERLAEVGRPIPVLGLRRIERGERRVDADDLAALAVALRVSPMTLLLPWSDDPEAVVEITAAGAITARQAWGWADGEQPISPSEADRYGEELRFRLDSRPPWARGPLDQRHDEALTEASKRSAVGNVAYDWSKETDGTWVLRTPAGIEIWRGPAPE